MQGDCIFLLSFLAVKTENEASYKTSSIHKHILTHTHTQQITCSGDCQLLLKMRFKRVFFLGFSQHAYNKGNKEF